MGSNDSDETRERVESNRQEILIVFMIAVLDYSRPGVLRARRKENLESRILLWKRRWE